MLFRQAVISVTQRDRANVLAIQPLHGGLTTVCPAFFRGRSRHFDATDSAGVFMQKHCEEQRQGVQRADESDETLFHPGTLASRLRVLLLSPPPASNRSSSTRPPATDSSRLAACSSAREKRTRSAARASSSN